MLAWPAFKEGFLSRKNWQGKYGRVYGALQWLRDCDNDFKIKIAFPSSFVFYWCFNKTDVRQGVSDYVSFCIFMTLFPATRIYSFMAVKQGILLL